jgi:hypothetical protein
MSPLLTVAIVNLVWAEAVAAKTAVAHAAIRNDASFILFLPRQGY